MLQTRLRCPVESLNTCCRWLLQLRTRCDHHGPGPFGVVCDSVGAVPPRNASLEINSACAAAIVPGGADGWSAAHRHPPRATDAVSQRVTLQLKGGGGALLRLTNAAAGPGCGALVRDVRQWWFDRRRINLKHTCETALDGFCPALYPLPCCCRPGDEPQGGSLQRLTVDASGRGYDGCVRRDEP